MPKPIDREAEIKAAKSAWAASPALRAEFCDDEACFVAYRLASAEGRIKIISRGLDVRGLALNGDTGASR